MFKERKLTFAVCLGSPTPTVSWMKDVEAISDVSRDPRVSINNTGSLRIESKLNKYFVAYLNNPPRFLPSQLSVFGWGRSGSDEKVRRWFVRSTGKLPPGTRALSLNSRHPLDILNTGRNSVFLLKMFSVIFLLWKSESIFAASKISKPWPNQPQPTVMIFALQRAVQAEYCCRIQADLTFKHR